MASTESPQLTPSNRPPPKKRNRQALSCTACRERKIKCDRVVPCAQCVKRGDQQFCRIETKPKIIHSSTKSGGQAQPKPQQQQPHLHAHVHAHNHTPILQPEQPETAHSSTTSLGATSPHEVEAIKARLAQLEAALAQRLPVGSSSASPSTTSTSSHNLFSPTFNPRASSSSASSGVPDFDPSHRLPPLMNTIQNGYASSHYVGGNAPATQFPQINPRASLGGGGHANSPTSYYRATSGSVSGDDAASSSPHLSRLGSPSTSISTSSNWRTASGIKSEVDSDTEDAALVLERLAMGGGGLGGRSVAHCPEKKMSGGGGGGAAAKLASDAECTESSTAATRCDDLTTSVRFEGCVRADKVRNIMLPSAEEEEKKDAVMCPESNDETEDVAMGEEPSHSLPGASSSQARKQQQQPGAACSVEDETEHEGSQAGEGSRAGSDTGSGGACKKDPLNVTPIAVPCKRACNHKGLFKLKCGPETLLGWGMGWAWATGSELLDQQRQEAIKEGRKWRPTEKTEREAVLTAVCASLPSKELAAQLITVYETRVRNLAGHVVHVPCLRREMEAFYALDSYEKRARVVNHVDASWLSLFLSILILGLRFYPCYPEQGWVSADALFDGKTIHAWYSAAKTCLVLAGYLNSTSMSVLQSILLLNLYSCSANHGPGADLDQGTTSTALIRVAIANAQEMGLHRLGDKDAQPNGNESTSKVVRMEIAKRVWWALVFKDWCSAGSGCTRNYIVHPDQFNTPFPGNYNDSDLLQNPLPPQRPRTEYTEMSFVLANLEMGMVIREDVDLRLKRELAGATHGGDRRLTCQDVKLLDQKYRRILEEAPDFFQVGSEIGEGSCMEISRWLLQQGVFSKLLRLHRPNLSSRAESRTNCVLLARSILDMQKKIRARCTVLDRLWVNLMQSFSAAIVLSLHLLHTRPEPDHRLSVRSEIAEAINALKHIECSNYTAQKCIRVIEALMAEEEERWVNGFDQARERIQENGAAGHKRKRDGDGSESGVGKRKNLLSLAQRVALATKCPQAAKAVGSAKAAAAAAAGVKVERERLEGASSVLERLQRQHSSETGGGGGGGLAVGNQSQTQQPIEPAKDDVSKALMGQLMLPNAAPSPWILNGATTEGGNEEDGSSGVNFPHLSSSSSSSMPQAFLHQGQLLDANHAYPINVDVARRSVAPNGLDLSFNNPLTPPDGQPFDLAAFLDQCEDSPGSSSGQSASGGEESSSGFFGGSGGDGGRANSTSSSSSPLMQVEAGGEKDGESNPRGGLTVSDPASNQHQVQTAPRDQTGMDGFWNWILSQGAAGLPPLGTSNGATPSPGTQANVSQVWNGGSVVFSDGPSSTTTMPAPFRVGGGGSSSLPDEKPINPSAAPPFLATHLVGSQNVNVQAPLPPPPITLGTPSAGFGLESWLAMPTLYEFTDLAPSSSSSSSSSNPLGQNGYILRG
ncbi:hypothetical protein IE53DRAFT_366905 [Violaceomyces palustris]|uniref:Uncharacterized protein n=1 Tax=Violaceomyces palustris TaxID=1673888 RepID=A0ACD0P3W9_9BASI|nr:hypothetical protein IE53DRAFT_366905 [Violaceomyces palustris]